MRAADEASGNGSDEASGEGGDEEGGKAQEERGGEPRKEGGRAAALPSPSPALSSHPLSALTLVSSPLSALPACPSLALSYFLTPRLLSEPPPVAPSSEAVKLTLLLEHC